MYIGLLQQVPLWADLPKQELRRLSKVAVRNQYQKNQLIFRRGDKNRHLHFILSGRIHVGVGCPELGQVVLYSLEVGDFFGEIGVFDGHAKSTTTIAAENTDVLSIPGDLVLEIQKKHLQVSYRLLTEFARRLHVTYLQVGTWALLNTTGRIAGTLMRLAEEQGTLTGQNQIELRLPTHQVIAEMVGTTRETVTRALKQLRQEGFLQVEGPHLAIINYSKWETGRFF